MSANNPERVGQRALAEPLPVGRVEQVLAMDPYGHVPQRLKGWWRDHNHARLPVLRSLLAALTIQPEADRDLPALHVQVITTKTAELTGTTTHVAEKDDQRAELRTV